jgi:GGDEF domain-containing protein
MAARDPQDDSRPPNHVRRPISRAELADRLEEEISRACRNDTPLGLLLVRLDGQREVERVHGQRLASELFAYASHALTREFRRFDRLGDLGGGEFLALLPGADTIAAEIVARRVLGRLRAIKIEIRSRRQPVWVCASSLQWHKGQTANQAIEELRAAAAHERLGFKDALRI